MLKALARHPATVEQSQGILPRWMGRINRHFTPYWGVVLIPLIATVVVIAVDAQDQELVLFYAVAVFVSFLMGLLAMVTFSKCGLPPSLAGRQRARHAGGRFYPGDESAARMAAPLPGRRSRSRSSCLSSGCDAGCPRGIALAVQQAEEEPLPVLASPSGVDADQPVSGQHEVEQHQAARRQERPSGQHEQEELPQPGEAGSR